MPSAQINVSTSGDNTIIAAPPAPQFLRIFSIKIGAYGAVNVSLKSGSVVLDGPFPCTTDSGYAESDGINGLMDCAVNQPFIVNLDGAVQVAGRVTYAVKNM